MNFRNLIARVPVYVAAVFTSLTLSSCFGSSGEDAVAVVEAASGKTLHDIDLRIELQIDPETTRSSRELESSDAWQKVGDLRIYLFYSESGREGTFYYKCPVVYDPADNGLHKLDAFRVPLDPKADETEDVEHHVYFVRPRLESGYYRFLAIGRDDEPDSDLSAAKLNLQEELTEWGEARLLNSNGVVASKEFFVGINEDAAGDVPLTLHVEKPGGVWKRLSLRRHVAGLIMNVENIPDQLESEFSWAKTSLLSESTPEIAVTRGVPYAVSEVALISGKYNRDLVLTSHQIGQREVKSASRLYDSRLVSIKVDKENDSLEEGYYRNHLHEKGYYLSGSFLFPTRLYDFSFIDESENVGKDSEGNYQFTNFDRSVYLCFFYEDPTDGLHYPIRMFPVRIVRTLHNGDDLYSEEDTLIDIEGHFNILGNHLYSLGEKSIKNNEDRPIDLKEILTHPDLDIMIVGSWQADVDIEM